MEADTNGFFLAVGMIMGFIGGMQLSREITRIHSDFCLAGAVSIFQYGAGPNGVMRTLGKFMLGSGATFGYAPTVSLPIRSEAKDFTILTNCDTECSCPLVASSEPKAPTTKPGVESTQTLLSFLENFRNDDKNGILTGL